MNDNDTDRDPGVPIESFLVEVLNECSPKRLQESQGNCLETPRSPAIKRKHVTFNTLDRWHSSPAKKPRDRFPPSPVSPQTSRWDESQERTDTNATKQVELCEDSARNQSLPPLQPRRKGSHVSLEDIFAEHMLLDARKQYSEDAPTTANMMKLPLALHSLPYSSD